MHFEEVTGCDRLQRLTRLQCRQRAFEAGEIELRRAHVSNMEKQAQIVNATAFSSEVDTGSREENASRKIRSGLHRTGTRPSGPARRASPVRRVRPARRYRPATTTTLRLRAETSSPPRRHPRFYA